MNEDNGEFIEADDLGPEHLLLAIERTNEYLCHRRELLERLTPRERVPVIVMLTVQEIELIIDALSVVEGGDAGIRLLRADLSDHIEGYESQLPS